MSYWNKTEQIVGKTKWWLYIGKLLFSFKYSILASRSTASTDIPCTVTLKMTTSFSLCHPSDLGCSSLSSNYYHSHAFCNLMTTSNSTVTWISWPQLGKRCLHEVQQVGDCCHFKSAMVLIREGGSWLHNPPSCQVWCPRAQLNSIKRSPLLFCGLHLNNNFLHLILRTSAMVSHREIGTVAKLTL